MLLNDACCSDAERYMHMRQTFHVYLTAELWPWDVRPWDPVPTNVHDSDCAHAFSSPVGTVVLALFVMLYALIPRVESNDSTHFPVFLMCSRLEVSTSNMFRT